MNNNKLLDGEGEFVDDILENNYQIYVNRKIKKGKTPRDRLEWKKASDYWTKDIRSNAYPELDGSELDGQYILEIPASNVNLSNIDYYRKVASEYDVTLRFTEEG